MYVYLVLDISWPIIVSLTNKLLYFGGCKSYITITLEKTTQSKNNSKKLEKKQKRCLYNIIDCNRTKGGIALSHLVISFDGKNN